MKKKKYYILELDSYDQPNGFITEQEMTRTEFLEMQKSRGYVYEKYEQALYRVQD